MSFLKGNLLYTADAVLAGANGASKTLKIEAAGPRHALCHIYVEADVLTTSAVVVTLQGRLSSSSAWVVAKKQDDSTSSATTQVAGALVDTVFPVQLFPEMRAVISGTYAATAGNDIRVTVLCPTGATVTTN